jgi:hypothetical protein
MIIPYQRCAVTHTGISVGLDLSVLFLKAIFIIAEGTQYHTHLKRGLSAGQTSLRFVWDLVFSISGLNMSSNLLSGESQRFSYPFR